MGVEAVAPFASPPLRLAIVGGGWAGLAAAVRATQAGHQVTLLEMARQLGGRARSVAAGMGGNTGITGDNTRGDAGGSAEGGTTGSDMALDNGQHILIGAYRRTLDLMRTVDVDTAVALHRQALDLRGADGRGMRLPPGPAWLAFVRGVLACKGWTVRERLALLAAATGWAARGFRCDAALTVDQLCAGLPTAVRALLIDPLCVAALNTPARDASAAVLLRVLRDALFGGPGSADLLLPRQGLGALLPEPAERWLRNSGATLRLGARVQTLIRASDGNRNSDGAPGPAWQVDGEPFDAVVLACSAHEAARLAAPLAPGWAQQALALRDEPIVTVYLHGPGARLPAAMVALQDSDQAPAQFAFDHGALGTAPDRFAFVISGARQWMNAGMGATVAAVLRQAEAAFPPGTWPVAPTLLRAIVEKRATFRCTPLLQRPSALIAPGLAAAGDYIAGPYPATLEGAVRAGEAAVGLATGAMGGAAATSAIGT